MENKILIICPKYYPQKDGLSGHTTMLARSLSKKAEVSLLTSVKYTKNDFPEIKVFPLISQWKFKDLYQQTKSLNLKDYNQIFIQYVPTLYAARGGINFSILIYFFYLKLKFKGVISILFHELYFPFSFYWKYIILNISHKLMLTAALLSTDRAFFSTLRFKAEAKFFTFKRNSLFHLPGGSNLVTESKIDINYSHSDSKRLVLFGSSHPSKNYNLVFKILSELYDEGEKFSLTLIGPDKESIAKDCLIPKNFYEFTALKTKVSDNEAVEVLRQSDLMLAYFVDGLTTRRSSVTAGFAAGLPVVSTISKYTEEIFKHDPEVVTLLPTDTALFSEELKIHIRELEKNSSQVRKSAIDFYQRHFSWDSISEKIILS